MRTVKQFMIGIMSVALSGCLYTFEPAYLPEDVFFEPSIVGTWQEKTGEDRYTFESLGDSAYKLVVGASGESSRPFEAPFFKIEQQKTALEGQFFSKKESLHAFRFPPGFVFIQNHLANTDILRGNFDQFIVTNVLK